MASLDRLTESQVLYTVSSQKAGNTNISRRAVHTVRVISVDLELRRVRASWNGNPARDYSETQVSKWKVKKPELKGGRL